MNNVKNAAMKPIKKFSYIFVLILALSSCSKDFLEQNPYGSITDEVFYATMDGLLLGVNGTYASINTQPAGLNNLDVMYIAFGSISSDDAEAGGETGGND